MTKDEYLRACAIFERVIAESYAQAKVKAMQKRKRPTLVLVWKNPKRRVPDTPA